MTVNHIVDCKQDEKDDDIDELMKQTLKSQSFALFCLNRNDKEICPSIWKLAKHLIKYKRWLFTIYKNNDGDNNIEKTIQADVDKFIDNNTFQNVFMETIKNSPKFNHGNNFQILIKIINEGKFNNETFLKNGRKSFCLKVKKLTNGKIKPVYSGKLYSAVANALKYKAQTLQFGEFLSDLDMDIIEKDYHHILKSHINDGNKTTMKNAFLFFKAAVHFEDVDTEVAECHSVNRKEKRINKMHSKAIDEENKTKFYDKIDIWTLKQYHIQSQLDIIHAYLVHSSWKSFFKRYSNRYSKDQDEKTDNETTDEVVSEWNESRNLDKFVTKIDNNQYGFGIEHSYHYLQPKYESIFDELVLNELCTLSRNNITNLLIKAIRKHKVALDEYKHQLICKHFKEHYNIIRNDPIGIRHIFSLITYTDMSDYCTVYRATYRMINDETNPEQVKQRHVQLYHYSRTLYEAVEFFGDFMQKTDKVYHGLDKKMLFEKFETYFNQPISTTPSFIKAQEFSKGYGIILTLRSATQYMKDPTKIPKYLSISWLSDFPQESEKLYYGAYIVFAIDDITEAETLTAHTKELSLLNAFQKTLDNQDVIWKLSEQNKIAALTFLIKQQQHRVVKKTLSNVTIDAADSTSYSVLFEIFMGNNNKVQICDIQHLEQPTFEQLNIAANRELSKYAREQYRIQTIMEYNGVGIEDDDDMDNAFTTLPNQIQPLRLKIVLEPKETNYQKTQQQYFSKYGTDLFNYFCDNPNRTWICIRNFKSLPQSLRNSLFIMDDSDSEHMSLIPLVRLFPNVKEITLNELDIDQMSVDASNYTNIVLDYIELNMESQMQEIIFKSKVDHDRKQNSTLNTLEVKYFNKFQSNGWSIKYKFQTEHTHNLVFTNNYPTKKISTRSNRTKRQRKELFNIYEGKENEIPSYFMQVTSVDADDFHVEVTLSKKITTCNKRKFFIKELNKFKHEVASNATVIVKKNRYGSGIDIDIESEHNEHYYLALYDSKNAMIPLQNSSKIPLIVLKDPKQFPPINVYYKPNCIDASTIITMKDYQQDMFIVYWSVPPKSFGEIFYKIVGSNEYQQESETIISRLPYITRLSSNSLSFTVITICKIGENVYQSDRSESITDSDQTMWIEKRVETIKPSTAPIPLKKVIREFEVIHKEEHRNLFDAIYEYFEAMDNHDHHNNNDQHENQENKNERRVEDLDILEMKIYKILFDILVSCYMKVIQI
eukprot:535397_1